MMKSKKVEPNLSLEMEKKLVSALERMLHKTGYAKERRSVIGDKEVEVGGVIEVSMEGVSEEIGLNRQRGRVKNLLSVRTT